MNPTSSNSLSALSKQPDNPWNHDEASQSVHPPRPLWNSISVKLFVPIVGSVLIGMGSVAFIVGEIIKYQAEAQIQRSLSDKAQVIDTTLNQAEQFADSLRTSALTLHLRDVNSAETYRRLMFELFRTRPDFVVGLGLGQSQNGLLRKQTWFSPYYFLDFGEPNAPGITFSSPYNEMRFLDGTQPEQFYPESDRYKNYFLPQKNVWSAPNEVNKHIKTTYYSQIIDDKNRWLGTVFVDISNDSFDHAINSPVFNQAGSFLLLNRDGQIIASPTASTLVGEATTYASIPDLSKIWSQMQAQSGLIEGEKGYWAYARIADGRWVMLAFVSYADIFGRIVPITVGGTLLVSTFVALILILRLRSLDRRLRPVLAECHQLAITEAPTLTALQNQDEIDQLAAAFSYLVQQSKVNREQIRQGTVSSVRAEERLKQSAIAEQEGHLLLEDVEHLIDIMSAVEKGNLTVSAQSSPRATGLIANTLNRSIEQFGRAIATVLSVTRQVSRNANRLEHLADAIADDAQQQTQAIVQVQTYLEQVNTLSQNTAQQAIVSNDAVQLGQTAIQKGKEEMSAVGKKIRVVRQGADQIAKRTQTLTNYVELANQFAKDQKRTAALTRVLAMNASMLASRASTQQDPEQFASISREFEIVAAQVNDLAVQTNQSLVVLKQRTDQIQTVVTGLDYDVQEINRQVNDFTDVVGQSHQIFDTIQSINEQVAQIGQHVAQSSQTIVETAQTASQSINAISTILGETSGQANTAREQAQQMQQLAHGLLQKIEFFNVEPQLPQVLNPVDVGLRSASDLSPSSNKGTSPTERSSMTAAEP